jgi:hypothetical protein
LIYIQYHLKNNRYLVAVLEKMMQQEQALDLGLWLGRRQAFGLIASRCSAADAECLKKIRESSSYRELGLTWEEFCKQRAGISRSYADRMIQQLNEFGEAYFHLAEIMQMSTEQYRQIADSVVDVEIEYAGEKITICRENADKIVHAVSMLTRQCEQTPLGPVRLNRRLATSRKRFDAWLADIDSLAQSQTGESRDKIGALLSGHVLPALNRLQEVLPKAA